MTIWDFADVHPVLYIVTLLIALAAVVAMRPFQGMVVKKTKAKQRVEAEVAKTSTKPN